VSPGAGRVESKAPTLPGACHDSELIGPTEREAAEQRLEGISLDGPVGSEGHRQDVASDQRRWHASRTALSSLQQRLIGLGLERGGGRRADRHVGRIVRWAEAGVVESTLALELLAKLQRFGGYDARILEDVARRTRAASSSKKGESPS
jgi:hypothetical protein